MACARQPALHTLALIAGLGANACGGSRSSVRVDVLARDVLAEATWEVVHANPGFPPVIAELCPSLAPERNGTDMLALVLPPPGEVRFRIGDEGPAVLTGAAGVAFDSARKLSLERPEVAIRFEVLVNGGRVFEHEVELAWPEKEPGYEWSWIGALPGQRGGLEVARGDEIVLRTSAFANGAPLVPDVGFEAGFARVELVHPRDVATGPATRERPNLILVLQDTQRADRLGAYGYERGVSPALDLLAARGTTFENAYATSSWTWPSTASVLTGMQPAQHGVVSEESCYLDTRIRVLPEALREAGYRTAGFSGSRLILSGKGFDQGFERFDSFRGKYMKSNELVPRAIEWIEAHANERFFCFLHLVDTHAPHLASAEALARWAPDRPADFEPALFQEYTQRLAAGAGRASDGTLDPGLVVPEAHRRYLSDLYDACVWEGDRWLGALVAALDGLGLEGRTVIAFTSDHGEELFDHGKLEHGHSLYGELVRVPLVMAGPGVAPGARVALPVSNRQIAPTLARLGGARLEGIPDAFDLQGELHERWVVFSTEHGVWRDGRRSEQIGMVRDDWSLHVAPEERGDDGTAGVWRLFDLGVDPGETRDLASEQAGRAGAMRADLERYLESLVRLRTSPGRAADAATLETMRAMGYLGDESGE